MDYSQGDFVFACLLINCLFLLLPVSVFWPLMFRGFAAHDKVRLGLYALGLTTLASAAVLGVCLLVKPFAAIMAPGGVFIVGTVYTFMSHYPKYPAPTTPKHAQEIIDALFEDEPGQPLKPVEKP
jgi:hypothetical protein